MNARLFSAVVAVVACHCAGAQNTRLQNLQQLIDAEKGFADMAAKTSFKIAFLKNLDSTGIIFDGAEPVNGLRFYNSRPDDNALLFKWYPVQAEIAAIGDMGFTTGPYLLILNKTKDTLATGNYFSIWKKDNSGTFKVLLDGGVTHPDKTTASSFGKLPIATAASTGVLANEAANGSSFAQANAAFVKQAEGNMLQAYETFMAGNSYVLRPGMANGAGKTALLQELRQTAIQSASFNYRAQVLAGNNGFGFTYGPAQITPAGGKQQQGYFVHVWQFQPEGWKIIADVLQLINY